MKKMLVAITAMFLLTGFSWADEYFDELCVDTPETWTEPSEEDFPSYDVYFSFLNRRATWARAVEQGSGETYFEWLLQRYYWDSVTFADRDYACYSHLTRR